MAKMESYYQELPEEGAFSWYPGCPWLRAHSAGHPVKFAQMMSDHADNMVFEISVYGKPN